MEKKYQKALAYAFFLLKYRLRSVYEIRDRLKRKGYQPDDIEKVVDFLTEQGYLDDRQFSLSFARAKLRRGFGPARVKYELRRLGIPENEARDAVQEAGREVRGNMILRDLARRIIERKKDRNKAIRYLMQRGFRYAEIVKAFDED